MAQRKAAGFLMPRGGEDDVWAALETRSSAFVGWFSLRRVREGVGELGYRLRRDPWGRGLASAGATALVAMGFADKDFARIVATTIAVNRSSCRVLEKTGLTQSAMFIRAGAAHFPGANSGRSNVRLRATSGRLVFPRSSARFGPSDLV